MITLVDVKTDDHGGSGWTISGRLDHRRRAVASSGAGVRRCAVSEIGHVRAAFALRSFSTCLDKRTRRKLSLPSGGSTMNLFHPQIAAALAATISLRMAAFGASRPLRRIPAIVCFLNPQPALSLVGGNRSSWPLTDLVGIDRKAAHDAGVS
jgi:hypothetical protein